MKDFRLVQRMNPASRELLDNMLPKFFLHYTAHAQKQRCSSPPWTSDVWTRRPPLPTTARYLDSTCNPAPALLSCSKSSRSPTPTWWVHTEDRTETRRQGQLTVADRGTNVGKGVLGVTLTSSVLTRSLWHSVMTRTRKHRRTTVLSSFFSRRRISWVTSGWGTALCISTSPSNRTEEELVPGIQAAWTAATKPRDALLCR